MNFKGHSSAHNKYRRQEVERKQLSQFLGRLIRTWTPPGSSRRRKGSGALETEIGVWNSQGGGKDKHLFFFFSTFLSLSHIKLFFFFFPSSPELMITQLSLNSMCMRSHFSRVQLSVTQWTMAHQAPLSMGFSRQEYWSGLPFPSPVIKYEVSEVSEVKLLSRV